MVELARPRGDSESISDEEQGYDIMLNPERRSSGSEGSRGASSQKIPSIFFPYIVRQNDVDGYQATALEFNKITQSIELSEFLRSKRFNSSKLALTASLKYHKEVCDNLVNNAIKHRVFAVGSLALLWFHMALDDPAAVVPEAEIEVVLVRKEEDLAALVPRCSLYRFAIVLEQHSLRVGPWRLVGLDRGFPYALCFIKEFVFGTEKRIEELANLIPTAESLAGVLSASELEELTSAPFEDWKCYFRNRHCKPYLADIFDKVVAQSELLKLAVSGLQDGKDALKANELVTTYGKFTEDPAARIEIEVRAGASERLHQLLSLAKAIPNRTCVACLRFPDATSVATIRLQRLMKMLLGRAHRLDNKWLSISCLTHLKYVQEGTSACILLTANWDTILSFARHAEKALWHKLLLLDSQWLLPTGETVLKLQLDVGEQLGTWLKSRDPKAVKFTRKTQWTDAWVRINSKDGTFPELWTQEVTQKEVVVDGASELVGCWLDWMNYAAKRNSSRSREMARHIFQMLQEVTKSEEVFFELYGPVFSVTGKATVKGLQAYYDRLRDIKKE